MATWRYFCELCLKCLGGGNAVWQYAQARLALEQSGRRIGERDLLIAAHALAENLTLVTNNTREFERIDGLKLENWAV